MKYTTLLLLLIGCAQNPLDVKWQAVQNRQPIVVGVKTPTFEDIKNAKNKVEEYRYSGDINNYGVSDYWATPNEVKIKKSGDCEDYAIYEYYNLRKEGFAKDDLTIWIANKSKYPYTPHAILTVKFNNTKYVLDNEIPMPVTWESVKNNYELIHSLN